MTATIAYLILAVSCLNLGILAWMMVRGGSTPPTASATSIPQTAAPSIVVAAASNSTSAPEAEFDGPLVDTQEVERKKLAMQRILPGGLAADIVIRSDSPMVEDVIVKRVVRE